MNFYQKTEKFPPILVRLLARKAWGPPLTSQEIAARSGLSLLHVETISHSTDWRGIDIPTMRAYLKACNVDFENAKQLNRIRTYLKNANWKYLRTSPNWRPYYLNLILTYQHSIR